MIQSMKQSGIAFLVVLAATAALAQAVNFDSDTAGNLPAG
jgi:hypothetical protein